MAKTVTIEVTPDEAEALEAIRPYAAEIARGARKLEAEFPGGTRFFAGQVGKVDPWIERFRVDGYLAALFEILGEDALWVPAFWLLLSGEVGDARTDPTAWASALGGALGWPVAKTAAERDACKARSDSARAMLEGLMTELRGKHRAGRVKRIDEQATEDAVYRLARAIENTRGEERGATRRALERLAPAERVKPGALKKRITRRRPA